MTGPRLLLGDCREVLKTLPDASVDGTAPVVEGQVETVAPVDPPRGAQLALAFA